ncbi:MAG: hypothetical protein HYY23_00150 [Verrucomicrobia bacterium]|nr:hypothetical protein [Verrucomicrobiota bacterium]
MSTTKAEPLPLEVGQLGNFEARMLRSFRAAVDDWDEVCSALGAWEAQHLTSDDATPAKEHHRIWVAELLSWGQHLQRVTTHSAFPDQALSARINARLRHLQDKLSVWHRDMAPEEEDRILRAAFP